MEKALIEKISKELNEKGRNHNLKVIESDGDILVRRHNIIPDIIIEIIRDVCKKYKVLYTVCILDKKLTVLIF
ncbi:hypothetical protein [Tenacibaculum jejuense]|uniref:hypothetical protein n=1 Tax=Tenacibaculum jejuense TaxID=584609 RepID=UPI000BA4DEB5|nr:hypothetical protein [Tenacibaculum jejuense]